ncbi:MAG: polyprenyl synthetase family protein, partial [Nanoarchaeota archaeon]
MDLKTKKHLIRHCLSDALQNDIGQDSRVIDASRYMSLNGSSGLYRPLLLLSTAECYSVPIQRALPIAVAIELAHVASLIADDIMDNSDKRRGSLSCHKKYGRDIASLSHMYLREVVQEMIDEKNDFSDKQKRDITRRALHAGKKMIYGQEKDVLQRDLDTPEKIIEMYEQKTGSLIGSALACGGIIGDACHDDINRLNYIGIAMGVSYQIIDDALDERASSSETGKPSNQDLKKQTLVKMVGWDKIKMLKSEKDALV